MAQIERYGKIIALPKGHEKYPFYDAYLGQVTTVRHSMAGWSLHWRSLSPPNQALEFLPDECIRVLTPEEHWEHIKSGFGF